VKTYFCCICADDRWPVEDLWLGYRFCARCFVELVKRVGFDAKPSDVLRAVADMIEEHQQQKKGGE